jgi:tetratricopeptide (TPR) repeat protein
MMGNNILIENGNFNVIGDVYWGNNGGYKGPSLITDITALDNGIYFGLDKVRGRLFGYDTQGNLLYAFGGNGNMDGRFKAPSALEHMGTDLIVLDSQDASFTVFTPTEYGNLIYQAIEEYDAGDYEASGETWEKVKERNGNYDLAYIGIGRSLMRQGEYKEAMKYFKLKWDEDNYSKAFKQYRKQWVEDHIGYIFAGVFILFILPMIVSRVKKVKYEIDSAEIFRQ